MNQLGTVGKPTFMLATPASVYEAQRSGMHLDVLARDLNMGFGAVGTMLAAAGGNGFAILGCDGPAGIEGGLFDALNDWGELSPEALSRGACRWRQSTVNGRRVDLLAAPLHHSTNSGEIFLVSLFDPPVGGDRASIEIEHARRRSLAASYLEIWLLNQSRREREAALEAALSTIRTGVVLLDDQADVVFSNTVASSMFEAADCLKLHRRRLLATNLRDNVRLTVALQHVSALGESEEADRRAPMLALERSDRTTLILLALPLSPAQGAQGDAVTILHIVDTRADFAEHVRPLCCMYRLSRAETDLACLLARGLTLAQAAEIMRIKEQTARSSLRSIFYKTGTSRQTELILLLLSRVVPTGSTMKIEPF